MRTVRSHVLIVGYSFRHTGVVEEFVSFPATSNFWPYAVNGEKIPQTAFLRTVSLILRAKKKEEEILACVLDENSWVEIEERTREKKKMKEEEEKIRKKEHVSFPLGFRLWHKFPI